MSATTEVRMPAARAGELLRAYRDGLLSDTVPFWLKRCTDYLDREYGGYCHMVARDGSPIDTDKGVWAQGRNVWLWATLYNTVERRDEWLEAAEVGVRFLDRHCFDPSDGRMYFHVARDGTPIRKRRYAFSESFAAIGYAAWARATGRDEYAAKAVRCFELFLSHVPTPKFTAARQSKGMSGPMIAITTAQTLRASIGYDAADAIIDRAIEEIERDFVKHDLQAVMEQVALGGSIIEHVDGRTLHPGHAIEGAWFIMEEAKHRGNDPHLVRLGCRMLDYMWERGWDREHGGIFHFVDLHGKPVQEYWHDMKFWWPHNETIIATLMAYQITGDERYARRHAQVHEWAYRTFADPEFGEWYGYAHRDGRLSSTTKGNLWKSAFHHPRMQLRCWRLIEEMTTPRSA